MVTLVCREGWVPGRQALWGSRRGPARDSVTRSGSEVLTRERLHRH